MSQDSVSVYVAGGWPFRHDVKAVMDRFRDEGFNVVSGWIERENGINTPDALANDAIADIEEITRADVVFAVLTDDKYAYRGSFTEIGCAIGQNKPVIIFCPGTAKQVPDNENRYEYSHVCQSNVFYWHPICRHVSTLEDGIDILKNLKN